MHLIYLLYLMEYIQLISEASRPPGPLVCLIRSVSSRQYDANKNQPKWIEDWPSRQQIIRKTYILTGIPFIHILIASSKLQLVIN